MPTDTEFDQVVTDKVNEIVNSRLGANNAPQPLSLNLAGQNFQFRDQAELEASLNQFLGTVSEQQRNSAEALKVQQQQEKQNFATGDETPAWNTNEFVEKMTKDPRQALSYGLNHLLFDGKSPDAVADIRRTFDENEKVKQSLSAYQFKDAHPEFRANPQVVAQLDKLRSDMGLPFDYNGLEAAYLMGINRGVLPNFPAQYQQELAQRTQQFMPQQQQIPPDPYAQYVPGYIPTAQGAPQTMDPRQF